MGLHFLLRGSEQDEDVLYINLEESEENIRQNAASFGFDVRTAYLSGFFGWSRESTGEEIADSLGITPSTLHQHLRVAERKLLDAFFDRDGSFDT